MKVTVNEDCIGCGMCEGSCPEVFSIGDEINDLPMIEAFNGFTVDTAREAIQAKARKVYQGVGMMLEANL